MAITPEQILEALRVVQDPDLHRDIVSLGFVQNIRIDDERVKFDVVLTTPACPVKATLHDQARAAVMALPDVQEVDINMTFSVASAQKPGGQDGLIPQVRNVVAVASGKGGVGKSTVSTNLAIALAESGASVGLMDADIYGPNIPRMMGVDSKPDVVGGKIQPLEQHGVKLMSLGFIVERDAPAIWRGPIIMKIINQFLRDVAWGELDFFLVDLPPGTGDAQLSLAQSIHLHGALIVTTPQEMAVGDSLRGAKMFERVGVGVLGIVENMSYYVCPHCHERSELFLAGGGQRLADELGVPLLGQVPLQAGVPQLADTGRPIVVAEPASPAATVLAELARTVAAKLGGKSVSLPLVAR